MEECFPLNTKSRVCNETITCSIYNFRTYTCCYNYISQTFLSQNSLWPKSCKIIQLDMYWEWLPAIKVKTLLAVVYFLLIYPLSFFLSLSPHLLPHSSLPLLSRQNDKLLTTKTLVHSSLLDICILIVWGLSHKFNVTQSKSIFKLVILMASYH